MAHIRLDEIISIHRAMGEPLRVLIIRLLWERELCVCELMDVLAEPQYKISRHLAVLKEAGLVRDWREGTWMHYEIAPTLPPVWHAAFRALCRVWDQSAEVQAALQRLHRRAMRPPGGAACCNTRTACADNRTQQTTQGDCSQ